MIWPLRSSEPWTRRHDHAPTGTRPRLRRSRTPLDRDRGGDLFVWGGLDPGGHVGHPRAPVHPPPTPPTPKGPPGDVAVNPWWISWKADPRARVLADRHYTRHKIGAPQFVPPGRSLVLVDPGAAYWVTSWPFTEYVRHEWAGAWQCSAFRREGGDYLASDLIRWAVAATRWRYGDPPDLGMVTFVDAGKVRHKRDPGRCFRRAGFDPIGHTASGLLALRLSPDAMPAPAIPLGVQGQLFGGFDG